MSDQPHPKCECHDCTQYRKRTDTSVSKVYMVAPGAYYETTCDCHQRISTNIFHRDVVWHVTDCPSFRKE